MRLSVLLFASYADAFGRSALELDVPDDLTVGELVGHLRAQRGAARLPERPLVALNQAYAEWDQRIMSTDEVAVIPPVAGG